LRLRRCYHCRRIGGGYESGLTHREPSSFARWIREPPANPIAWNAHQFCGANASRYSFDTVRGASHRSPYSRPRVFDSHPDQNPLLPMKAGCACPVASSRATRCYARLGSAVLSDPFTVSLSDDVTLRFLLHNPDPAISWVRAVAGCASHSRGACSCSQFSCSIQMVVTADARFFARHGTLGFVPSRPFPFPARL